MQKNTLFTLIIGIVVVVLIAGSVYWFSGRADQGSGSTEAYIETRENTDSALDLDHEDAMIEDDMLVEEEDSIEEFADDEELEELLEGEWEDVEVSASDFESGENGLGILENGECENYYSYEPDTVSLYSTWEQRLRQALPGDDFAGMHLCQRQENEYLISVQLKNAVPKSESPEFPAYYNRVVMMNGDGKLLKKTDRYICEYVGDTDEPQIADPTETPVFIECGSGDADTIKEMYFELDTDTFQIELVENIFEKM